ncbi:hypothetical protein CUZ56_02375 [Saezia sanguinis]|uniref:Polymerase nucleotidyl transferase domain-containing protein n=1 Tax=Saezia sanguinis TaxID=1965230 RepID=A0A433SBA5_9BURK|nr:nucleotidyltransferase domain-containing protein [Saezia sanguinis]RUS66017.1 hypothetical protein CUZ56_02375 [Saezia sanguinis]
MSTNKPAHGTTEDNIEIQKLFHALKVDPLAWAKWYMEEANKRRRPSEILAQHRQEAIHIIEEHKGLNPRVFGSVARGDDTINSDINIMIDAQECSMVDLGRMRTDLQKLLGVPVSLIPSDFMFPQIEQATTVQTIPLDKFPK